MACCENLANIQNACAGGRGTAKDIIKVYVACEDDVVTIPDATDHVISGDIEMDTDKTFFQWDIDPVGSSWKITTQGEGQAKEYLMTGIFKITGISADVTNGINSLIRGNAVCIIRDKNGLQQLVGAIDDGALFAIEAQNDPNGYLVTVTYASGSMPYFYTGAITLPD